MATKRKQLRDKSSTFQKFQKVEALMNELGLSFEFINATRILLHDQNFKNRPVELIEIDHGYDPPCEFPSVFEIKLVFETEEN